MPNTERVRDLLDLVVFEKIASLKLPNNLSFSELQACLEDVYVDVSQSHVRRPYSNKEAAKCLTTGSIIYSFGRDSVILPLELMMWHGHRSNVGLPDCLSQRQFTRLAGEGMALPSLASVVWGVYLTKQFPPGR